MIKLIFNHENASIVHAHTESLLKQICAKNGEKEEKESN